MVSLMHKAGWNVDGSRMEMRSMAQEREEAKLCRVFPTASSWEERRVFQSLNVKMRQFM